MNKKIKVIVLLVILVCLVFSITRMGYLSEVPKFELPLLITCTGQTPGYLTMYALTKKLKIESINEPLATPRKMEDKGYKTMIVVMSASLKGLGAAGLNQKEELERCNLVFKKAKELGIKIIGAHIGGEARRNAIADKFITPFASQCDYLLILADGNKDDLFTKIAEENKIPITVLETFAELPAIITAMFK